MCGFSNSGGGGCWMCEYNGRCGVMWQEGWHNLHLKLEAVAIEAGLSHYKTWKSIKADISENDEDGEYKGKEELPREDSLSGHDWANECGWKQRAFSFQGSLGDSLCIHGFVPDIWGWIMGLDGHYWMALNESQKFIPEYWYWSQENLDLEWSWRIQNIFLASKLINEQPWIISKIFLTLTYVIEHPWTCWNHVFEHSMRQSS